jgi:hypothetical protein
MSDTEILNWIVRELRQGRILAEDWQREELLCEIKVRRMRDKAERDARIHDESESSRIDPGWLLYGKGLTKEKVEEIERTRRVEIR